MFRQFSFKLRLHNQIMTYLKHFDGIIHSFLFTNERRKFHIYKFMVIFNRVRMPVNDLFRGIEIALCKKYVCIYFCLSSACTPPKVNLAHCQ